MIAALYVESGGAYFGLEGVDPWDRPRDAMRYDGPHPVVAHPPCSRWCRLAGLVEARWGHARGDDGGTFAHALACVQRCASPVRTFPQGMEIPGNLIYFRVDENYDGPLSLSTREGDPIAALRALAPFLRSCHLKDAIATKVPGTWGDEVVVGTGQVDWRAFFRTLDEVGFKGDLAIEREAGTTRVADIRKAREFVLAL